MKQKTLVYYFLIFAISFTLFLPVLNLSFTYAYKKITIQHFSKRYLFSTDNFESVLNYVAYKAFDFSLDEANVIVGEKPFFFLGNSHASIIDKTKGTFLYADKDIKLWADTLKKLQEWYENQGIKFILAIAPNKHSVYSDKLPKSIIYKEGKTITDAIVKHGLDKGIHIVNLKNVLKQNKEEKQLFFHTDTHWTNYGALLGYEKSMEYLNSIYKTDYKVPKYTSTEINSDGSGDLTRFLKINHFLADNYEKDYSLAFQNSHTLCYGEITKANTLKGCTPSIKNQFNQYSVNTNAVNQEKLLYLCDSFGLANSQLYSKTFHTVWRFHISYTHGKMLEKFLQENKPDIVIYQVVERDLGNKTILDDMP